MITCTADFSVAGVDWRHEESIGLHRSAGGSVRWCVGCVFSAGRKGR
jgi:hypothetical protein